MSSIGRRLAVVSGLLLVTMVISGVAGAEPDRVSVAAAGAKATAGGTGQAATSVAGEQYAVADGSTRGDQLGKPGKIEAVEPGEHQVSVPSGNRAEPSGGGSSEKSPHKGSGGNAQQSTSQQSTSQQTASKQVQIQQGPEQKSGSHQAALQSVSRESSAGSGGAKARAKTVQSPEIRRRVRKLRQEARAGDLPPAATRYGKQDRRRELRIARRKIVSHPVEEMSLERYKKLYEDAAKKYGFGEDWYILAAVGKVESDHGRNMGPSSAGALGPMQFMPSTWESYGLDANNDGKANIMDPEDAIPAAAHYLKVGGAPENWYKALYSYNHAGWYVEKVLRVAERYRKAAGDEKVGPYYKNR